MTRDEIRNTLTLIQQAYRDSLDGKSISFTGVNGRAITNHDPAALRKELEYWENRWDKINRRRSPYKLAHFR